MEDFDQTRLAPDSPSKGGQTTGANTTGGAGWLSSSGSIDHGRFEPGLVVDGRYRVIGLLGKGGMGEVYRADDLRLGQPVAIKLLPTALASDPQRLVQFHNEVRTARQVSHPNVCRVYDIGDLIVSGSQSPQHQLYLTMEYVDGEDLSSLIRRIGRLPEDKALEIARQICAGLAAAHSRGVIHRDLKPANIMLDSAGQVRLMDFSLAAIGAVTDVRAGTPAYMAPEQLSGAGVTAQSDIFSLGLVLYELFTGRRGFQAKTLGELVDLHQTGAIVPPSVLVTGLNPAIERVILRCIATDPASRPQSAMSVAAALPGGDPLAAALAAGETPSPQMVAAAGDEAAPLAAQPAALWLVVALTAVVATALLSNRLSLYASIAFDRAPATLFDRARDIERIVGAPAAIVDRSAGMGRTAAPLNLVYWYRSSPAWLVPEGMLATPADPHPTTPGDTTILLDLNGRLLSFTRLPTAAPDSPTITPDLRGWTPVLEAAGLDVTTFAPVTPTFTPRLFADSRLAWTTTWPDRPETPVTIEVGSRHGRPAYFRMITGSASDSGDGSTSRATAAIAVVALLVGPGLLLIAAFVARANVKAGRGDRLGARRLASVTLLLTVAAWVLSAHHVADVAIEQRRLFNAIGRSMFDAAMLWAFYLAAEPYVRRSWPHILITWSRLLAGGFRDPLVGRDLLIGAACGTVMTVISYLFHLVPGWLGWAGIAPHGPELVLGTRALLARMFSVGSNAMNNAMLGVLGLALLRAGLHRVWPRLGTTAVAFGISALLFTPLAARGQFQSGYAGLDLFFGGLLVITILTVLFRFGLFAGIVGFFCHFWTWGMVSTLDSSKPFFENGLVALTLVVGVAISGYVLVRAESRR